MPYRFFPPRDGPAAENGYGWRDRFYSSSLKYQYPLFTSPAS